MKAFTVASHFCIVSLFNFWVKLSDLSCELCVGPQIYVLNLIWYQSLGGTRHFSYYRFILGSKKKLSKIAPSSTAPEAENLPLNIPSKGIVDQACLINYVGCEENSKSAGFRPYFGYLIVWFICLSISFTAFATTARYPSLHSKWPLHWSSLLHSTTTSGRRAWRFNYTPKGSLDLQWRHM